MRHLNYSHLHYFWAVAREGSIVAAAEMLSITPQTISGQIKMLEDSVGGELFERVGRRLVLTALGHEVFRYADEIFVIGAELANFVKGQHPQGPLPLRIGIVESMPKLIAERIIAPVLQGKQTVRLVCREASLQPLLGELATHRLDLVLSDQPMPPDVSLRAYNHTLGQSGMSFFARKGKIRVPKGDFPRCLDHAPMLLPSRDTALRRRLDQWFDTNQLAPIVIGEFNDSALMKAFGEDGFGIFAAPTAIAKEISSMYSCRVIGSTNAISEHFYAISPERRLAHPAVIALTEAARAELFESGG